MAGASTPDRLCFTARLDGDVNPRIRPRPDHCGDSKPVDGHATHTRKGSPVAHGTSGPSSAWPSAPGLSGRSADGCTIAGLEGTSMAFINACQCHRPRGRRREATAPSSSERQVAAAARRPPRWTCHHAAAVIATGACCGRTQTRRASFPSAAPLSVAPVSAADPRWCSERRAWCKTSRSAAPDHTVVDPHQEGENSQHTESSCTQTPYTHLDLSLAAKVTSGSTFLGIELSHSKRTRRLTLPESAVAVGIGGEGCGRGGGLRGHTR